MSVAFIFPGQGSQSLGMGKAFVEAFPETRYVFEAINDTLGYRLSDIVWGESEAQLRKTQHAQPAIYGVSQMAFQVLRKQFPHVMASVRGMAGHSLGEYSALVAAESFGLEVGARLLGVRGHAMSQESESHPGSMLAVLGVDLAIIESALDELGTPCVIANDNAPGQVVLSGDMAGLEAMSMHLKNAGFKKIIPLKVSGAFHSPLMKGAQIALEEALQETKCQDLQSPVISNVQAMPIEQAADVRGLLSRQLVDRVRWRESILYLWDQGVRTFVELGPGTVLQGLCKRIVPEAVALSLQAPEDLEKLAPVLG